MMSNNLQEKRRVLEALLPSPEERQIVVLTGARQTGKTTLAKNVYASMRYINFDAPEERDVAYKVASSEWHRTIGPSIIDEVQKEPIAFEKVKYAYDAGDLSFSVLLGSSQILLMKKIRESLAGRVALYELFPLLFCELLETEKKQPPIDECCKGKRMTEICKNIPSMITGKEDALLKEVEEHLLTWGGMPALLPLTTEQKWKWLRDYEFTYLERDLGDLARLQDLQPFRRFQQIASLRSGQLLNYADLARDADVSAHTAKRYLEYLRISYQAILLQPYRRNLTSALVKSPKLYWLDCGLLRQISGFREGINGSLYETMVVSEIVKWIRTLQRDVELFFYRTRSGAEVDLLIKTSKGIIGIEIKARNTVTPSDARILKEVGEAFGKEWLGGMVIYRGNTIEKISDPDIFAIPSRRLFG